jgi:hypothetical protein
MLLIGSRAIRIHFPEFRAPRDWDLIGNEEEIAALDRVLPRTKSRQRPEKAHFDYGDVVVEVANATASPYWTTVRETFALEPAFDEPVLGTLHVAPPAYLLLTKQCGLIYQIFHWHKNLEDLYFLRDRVPEIPEHIATLLPGSVDDSRRMFARLHSHRANDVSLCHPLVCDTAVPARHHRLHEVLALENTPLAREPGAWHGFPELGPEARRQKMRSLLAEEAMVVAAEQYLHPSFGFVSEDETELTRWALRMLAVGKLPEAWRYFTVNHYREIRALIPAGWLARTGVLEVARTIDSEPCASGVEVCSGAGTVLMQGSKAPSG